jgi:hypothetical protein
MHSPATLELPPLPSRSSRGRTKRPAPPVRIYFSESERVHIETAHSRLSLTPDEFMKFLREAEANRRRGH